MASTEKTQDLLTHRTVAKRLNIRTETLRAWVATGDFPEPHSIIKQTWFYPAGVIKEYLDTGRWPEGVRFKRTGHSFSGSSPSDTRSTN